MTAPVPAPTHYKAVRFRLYPNEATVQLLAQTTGCARWVYNYFLDKRIKHYKRTGKSLPNKDCMAALTVLKAKKEYLWLKDVDSTALQQSLNDLNAAYQGFFKHGRGFPSFHKKGRKESFRCQMSVKADIESRSLKIGKLGWIKARGSWNLIPERSTLQNITVSLHADRWYASVLFKTEKAPKLKRAPNRIAAIDLGVKIPVAHIEVNEDGEYRWSKRGRAVKQRLDVAEKRRKRYQRQLARKQKGSNNRQKTRRKLQRAYERETNIRNDWTNKVSNHLATGFRMVIFEDLNIKRMGESKNSDLNRDMRRLGLGALVVKTQRKVEARRGQMIFVDPRNTSRCCSACGHTSKQNRKSQAKFVCQACGHRDNADRNACHNILQRGLDVGKLKRRAAA